jgi:hypothetical protein
MFLLPPVVTELAVLVEVFCSVLQVYDYLLFCQKVLLGSIICCYFGATLTALFDMHWVHEISYIFLFSNIG